jgi:fatty acyl-CoA reductase
MKHLISVVHASTAYANCDLSETEERVYKPPVQPDKLIETTEWMSDDMLEAVTPKLLGRRPNTYTFAKALAESQLIEDAKDLPVIILRPSIIGAMWKEPLPGWTDNLNGPTGIFAAVGKGIIGNMCGSGNSKADIIPVDVVSNALIVAAAYRAELKTSEIPVIHCCSGELNPLKWGRVVNFLQHFYMKYPLDDCYRVPSTQFHTTRTMFLIHFYLKHYYPSQFMDIMGRIVGRKPSYVKLYGRVWKMVETLHYFTTRGWTFKSDGLVSLWNTLNDEDKKTFNFDVRQIDWDRYLFDYVMGVKVYLLREKLENLPKARSNLAWLKQISLYTNAAVWGLVVRLTAWKRTQKEKWTVWLIGFLLTYFYQNYNFRPSVYLKTLEEYKKTALMA